jgi:hypothetical protein
VPDWLRAVGPGWQPGLLRLHAQLLALDVDYRVEDLKEKLGVVRLHAGEGAPDAEIRGLAFSAVCEFRGEAGRRRRCGDRPFS